MSKVYLAGGFKSGWQKNMKALNLKHEYIDPSGKDETGWDYNLICAWDRLGISNCDVMFAYLEKDNPSGIGLACEIGYAVALNKPVIFVNEKEELNYKFLEGFSDFVTTSFEKGIYYLEKLQR